MRKSGPATLAPTRIVDYVVDDSRHLLGEYDASGKVIEETVYLGDLLVAVVKQSTVSTGPRKTQSTTLVYYVYADHLNTPRVITRASDNKIVWRWDQVDPFGVQQPDENPSGLGSFTYNPRFPGQVYDRESGLHYNYFRDYDPRTGRYVQSDPIGLQAGINNCSHASASAKYAACLRGDSIPPLITRDN